MNTAPCGRSIFMHIHVYGTALVPHVLELSIYLEQLFNFKYTVFNLISLRQYTYICAC